MQSFILEEDLLILKTDRIAYQEAVAIAQHTPRHPYSLREDLATLAQIEIAISRLEARLASSDTRP